MRTTLLLFFILLTQLQAQVIPSSRVVDWTHIGIQTPITNRVTILDVTADPYDADKTGVTNAGPAIQSAINDATANEVVYMPAGHYLVGSNSNLTIDKSNITLKGDGTNTVLWGLTSSSYVIKVGHDTMGPDPLRVYTITNGATKGSTSIAVASVHNGFGDTVKTGDMLLLSESTRNIGDDSLPIISVANYDRIIKQVIIVTGVSGNTITITPPLVWNFTNAPMMSEVDTLSQPRTGVSLQDFSVTLTNNDSTGAAGFMVSVTCARDCEVSNLDLGFANNYQLYIPNSVDCTVSYCAIHDPLSTGTSHSGMLMADDSDVLVENNIFTSDSARGLTLFPAIEVNDGVMGCAFFGNFYYNNSTDIDMHNTHPMMNLFEENVFSSFFEMDGYFGSSSHFTLFRNAISNTVPIKRFTSNLNIVGNVIGNTNTAYLYSTEVNSYTGPPWPLFEFGYPNIGNSGFVGTNPPITWNYPGKSLTGFFTESLTNGIFTFTGNYGPTNVLWTNMGTGAFTNIPAPINAGYALLFQDAVNTNLYWGDTNGSVLTSTLAGTTSNLTLASWVYVTNGETLYIAGQNAYQQLQSSNKYTHIITGNVLDTNGVGNAGTLSWSSSGVQALPVSYLYTNGAPSWWGSDHWPAIDPTNTTQQVYLIPAQERYLGSIAPQIVTLKTPAPFR